MIVTIVGGGIGGFSTARTLRLEGFEGQIRLIDPAPMPYDRPPLSKAYLAGTADAASLPFEAETWFTEHAIDLIPGTARLDGDRLLVDGRQLDTDATVLATGARPRRLSVPGGDDPGLHHLRTKDDADRLRPLLQPGSRLLIVGAGLIGAEVAATARALGAEVTLVDPDPLPLAGQAGPEIAHRLHAMHTAHGVETLRATPVRVEAARHVQLQDGRTLEADAVLIAIGSSADKIAVDAAQRANRPHTWAVGDVAAGHPEHWDSALRQGQTVACSILGTPLPPHGPAWFWTDRYGHHAEIVGTMTAPGHSIIRGADVAFRLAEDGTLVGAAAIDESMAIRAARRLIERGGRPDPAHLSDETVPWRQLTR